MIIMSHLRKQAQNGEVTWVKSGLGLYRCLLWTDPPPEACSRRGSVGELEPGGATHQGSHTEGVGSWCWPSQAPCRSQGWSMRSHPMEELGFMAHGPIPAHRFQGKSLSLPYGFGVLINN